MRQLPTLPIRRFLSTAFIIILIVLSSPCAVRSHLKCFLESKQMEVINGSKTDVDAITKRPRHT